MKIEVCSILLLCAYVFGVCVVDYSERWTGIEYNCYRKSLYTIPHDAPRNTTSLCLRDNHIELIDREILRKHTTDLRAFDLSFNNLSHLNQGQFEHLVNLVHLDLRYNRLINTHWSMPPGIFYGLGKLVYLYLGQCTNVRYITNGSEYPEKVFTDVPSVETLHIGCLSGNMYPITTEIVNLKNLKTLIIGYGRIDHIPHTAFAPLRNTSVETLSIAIQISFTMDNDTFANFSSLKCLQLAKHEPICLANALSRFGTTHLSDLVIDMSIGHLPTEDFCDAFASSLRRLTILNLKTILDVNMLLCLKKLKVLSSRFGSYKIYPVRLWKMKNFYDQGRLKLNISAVRSFELYNYGSASNAYHSYVDCSHSNQAPCYTSIADFFPRIPQLPDASDEWQQPNGNHMGWQRTIA